MGELEALGEGKLRWELELTCGLLSIREFCEIDLPIWMFDKDGSFQVVRLEQVCNLELVGG